MILKTLWDNNNISTYIFHLCLDKHYVDFLSFDKNMMLLFGPSYMFWLWCSIDRLQSAVDFVEREFLALDILIICHCVISQNWDKRFESSDFVFLFPSLTYVVAMPFYSASLIETVQVSLWYFDLDTKWQ